MALNRWSIIVSCGEYCDSRSRYTDRNRSPVTSCYVTREKIITSSTGMATVVRYLDNRSFATDSRVISRCWLLSCSGGDSRRSFERAVVSRSLSGSPFRFGPSFLLLATGLVVILSVIPAIFAPNREGEYRFLLSFILFNLFLFGKLWFARWNLTNRWNRASLPLFGSVTK